MEFASKSSTKFIADLTPDNIASMLVMTGTAASTLYGSEIANCTVLITIYYAVASGVLDPYGAGRKDKNSGSTIYNWGAYYGRKPLTIILRKILWRPGTFIRTRFHYQAVWRRTNHFWECWDMRMVSL